MLKFVKIIMMRSVFLSLVLMLALIACNGKKGQNGVDANIINNPVSANDPNIDKSKLPVITFTKTEHDFGQVSEGEKVSYSFKFLNSGKSDLLISNVIASCGCTVPSFPKKPIAPGETEFINVQFDSKGRSGKFTKDITVYSNTIPNSFQLIIKGNIIK
jgi:hypothetical protein